MTNPLVSFCLQAYNQREYIDAALDGAFAQTYRPLEIVISDDHSTDGTWERIQEKLKNSTVHLHLSTSPTVILHRNPTNLKNIANLEIFGTLAHGELLVKADGDDISHPDRTSRVVEAWLSDGKRAKVISSGCRVIDMEGRVLGERHDASMHNQVGAMQAWSRDCFTGWPEMMRSRAMDDVVWCGRAMLLGPELVIPDVLVDYRVGCGVSTQGRSYRETLTRVHEVESASLPICRADLAWYAAQGGDPTRCAAVKAAHKQRALTSSAWLQILTAPSLVTRLKAAHRVWHFHGLRGHVLIVLFILPFHLGDPLIERLRRKV